MRNHPTFGATARWLDHMTHKSVADRPLELARHKSFVAARLVVSACILAAAPFWTLASGALTLTPGVLLLVGLTPLFAVVAIAWSGDLELAQKISISSWVALAVASLAMTSTPSATYVLITIALIEAALTIDAVVIAGVGATMATLLVVNAIARWSAEGASTLAAVLMASPLMVYVVLLTTTAVGAEKSRTRVEQRNGRDLRLLTDAIGDIVLHLDRTAAVSTIVGDIHKTYGLDRRDLIGRGLFQRVHVADRPAFLKLVSDAIASQTTANAVLRVQVASTPNQSGRFMEPVFNFFDARTCHVGASPDGDDEARAPVVCILRDVTAAKRAEEEIAAARAESERATASKTRFLANISHELRTPLNAIIGFSEMLGSEELAPTDPAKRREYAQIISGSGHHLLEVVNTILDMSKIEAGSMQLFPEPFALPQLVDQCCDMMQLRTEETGVTLSREYSGDIDEIVADKRACKQILINLLSNAVKFTPAHGRVEMRLRPEGNFVALSVSDTGIGIASDDLERLGDPFFQASASHDRAYEGTGLGLSVVRGLVGLHGGSITVESAPKAGTTVTVRLPIDCRARETAGSMAKIEVIPRHGAINQGAREKGPEQEAVKKIA